VTFRNTNSHDLLDGVMQATSELLALRRKPRHMEALVNIITREVLTTP